MIPLHLRDLRHSKLHVLNLEAMIGTTCSWFNPAALGFIEMRQATDLRPIHVTPKV